MAHLSDTIDRDNLIRLLELEQKATEIRKVLLGALLLAKNIGKDKVEQSADVMKVIEEAEYAFVNTSLIDGFDKLDDVLNVIHKRAKALFMVIEYISK